MRIKCVITTTRKAIYNTLATSWRKTSETWSFWRRWKGQSWRLMKERSSNRRRGYYYMRRVRNSKWWSLKGGKEVLSALKGSNGQKMAMCYLGVETYIMLRVVQGSSHQEKWHLLIVTTIDGWCTKNIDDVFRLEGKTRLKSYVDVVSTIKGQALSLIVCD